MCCRKVDLWRTAFVVGLQKAGCAQAPSIAGLEANKPEFRARCAEVVSNVLAEREKFGRHNGANRVAAGVFRAGVAGAVSKEPSDGVG